VERLSLDPGTPYNGLEASIHLARYSIVRELCRDRRVLDIACGEGYGSSFLMRWGATEVVGVDRSTEAIERATGWFGDTVTFIRGDALESDDLLQGRVFDLIVALETIEHVGDPERFLETLRRLAAPSAIIVLSCPNDAWYYHDDEPGNPHHLTHYSFEEFQEMTERVLGKACDWAIGGPMAGFGTTSVQLESEAQPSESQYLMLGAVDAGAALVVPADHDQGVRTSNASYFVGLWAPTKQQFLPTMAVMPLGMDVFREARISAARSLQSGIVADLLMSSASPVERRVASLEARGERLRASLREEELRRQELETKLRVAEGAQRDAETEQRHALLRSEADRAELMVGVERLQQLSDEVSRLQEEVETLRLPAARYERLRRTVPSPLRRGLMGLYRAFAR
jgi:hypothetical protein